MIKKLNTSCILLTGLLTLSTPTHAEAGYKSWQEAPRPVEINPYSPGPAPVVRANWFWGLEGGAQRVAGISTLGVPNTNYYINPTDADYYSTKNSTSGFIGLDAGRLWQRHTLWFPAFSAAARYRYIFPHDVGGQVTQSSLAQVPSYNYKWNLSSNLITAQGKLNLIHIGIVAPYIGAGLGVASTKAHSYSETAIPPTIARISPAYASNTNNKFTYNLGAGLDFKSSSQMLWTLGYEYQSLGGIESDFGNDLWSQAKLTLGSVTNNMLLVSFSYLFDN